MNRPTWYYKPIEIPEIVDIQKEIIPILPQILDPNEEVSFFYVDPDTISKASPSYVKMLVRLGLLDRWKYSAVVSTIGNKEFPIHVDSTDWEERCYGLNLPILNCDHSDTVWYNADVIDTLVTDDYDRRNSARFCSAEKATEICRMPANTTAWVNISEPHRPESKNHNLRVVISARFSPEVHDLL